MPPDAFTFDTSGQLVMQTAIGGAGTLFGPLLGAAVWLYLRDFLQAVVGLGSAWKLVLGLVFVLLVCFLRRGLIGGLQDLVGRLAATLAPAGARRGAGARRRCAAAGQHRRRRAAARTRAFSGPVLEARGLTKSFGGLRRQPQHRFRRRAGRAARHHRPQRRGQEHVLQDADLRAAAELRPHHLPRPRHHRHGCRRGVPARADQELPGQPAFRAADVRENVVIAALAERRGTFRLDLLRRIDRVPRARHAGGEHAGTGRAEPRAPTCRSPSSLMARSGGWRSGWRSPPRRRCCCSTSRSPA